jgi:hypothetical protein
MQGERAFINLSENVPFIQSRRSHDPRYARCDPSCFGHHALNAKLYPFPRRYILFQRTPYNSPDRRKETAQLLDIWLENELIKFIRSTSIYKKHETRV